VYSFNTLVYYYLWPIDNKDGMQLESITLHNFQAHKDLTIAFSPTITTIKGATDKGKSAVLRALRWVCLNDTAGTDFIREGEKRALVKLKLDDGLLIREITRAKSKDGSVNVYDFDGKEFKAFGQGVPPDIARSLALNEINFQGQHDSPFWFAETAGEVSRKLNSVIDLAIIDTALANIGSEVRRAAERKSLCEERLKEAKAQLAELAPQKDRVAEFKVLKESSNQVIDTDRKWIQLLSIAERIEGNQAQTLAALAADGAVLLAAMLAARRAQRAVEVLTAICLTYEERKLASEPPPIFSPVRQAHSDWVVARDQMERLEKLVEGVFKADCWLNATTVAFAVAEKRFHEQLKGKRCPLCQNLIR
jgi:exonuclease SbcC